MLKKPSPTPHSVSHPFLQHFGHAITGILHGFDRLRLRGTLRCLYQPSVMRRYLWVERVCLTDFKTVVTDLTARICQRAKAMAQAAGRPWLYLRSGAIDKEELIADLLRREPVAQGLVAILRCVEPCQTYHLRGNHQSHQLELHLEPSRCLHLYFYHQHPRWGLMHLRLQTWFPFQVEICLNGRLWLARQLDQAGIAYKRQDNALPWIADVTRAQKLMDRQLRTNWPAELDRLLRQDHPLSSAICRPLNLHYYWSVCESEFATDVMFADDRLLQHWMPYWAQHGLVTFSSPDVMRFLGRRLPTQATVPAAFQGQIVSDVKQRAEGYRIKHRVNANAIKAYNRPHILRIETVINRPKEFRIWRRPEGQPKAPRRLRALRRGLADLPGRAQVCRTANERYLTALASTTGHEPIGPVVEKLCRPVLQKAKRFRALNPWSPQDRLLLEAISRGEFVLNGFRNRDLRLLLFPTAACPKEQRRQAGCITRQLRLLRAHHLIRKLPHTHRYRLTDHGRLLVTALLATYHADLNQITQLAA